jgi:WXG100 family type VII secretion target
VSGQFHVDPDRLEQIASRLTGLVGLMSDKFAELDRRVVELHTSSWTGSAAAAHAEAHRQWLSGAAEFRDGVKEMLTAASEAHGRYTAAVTANTKMFHGR